MTGVTQDKKGESYKMNRWDLIKQIENYCPYNEQEETDRRLILKCLREEEDIFDRGNCLAHMTASAWVINPGRTKVLMVYHNIYKSWSWPGGHADNEQDLLGVAVREVKEESGLTRVRPVSEDICSLEDSLRASSEPWMCQRIYAKLNGKLKRQG